MSTVSMPSTLSHSNSAENLWERLPNFSMPATLPFQPPPPTSQLHTVTAITNPIINTAYNSDSSMTGKHQMFYGDGRSSEPVPLNFLKVRRLKFKGWTDSEKIESVLNHLLTNSKVEIWYDSLDATIRSDWKKFKAMFKKNWPREMVATVTITEKRAKLSKEHLLAKDVLMITTVNGVEMTGRAMWIGKMKRLAAQAKDSKGALIGMVYEQLPDILRKHMKSEFADWDEFIINAQDVKEVDIHQSMKEDDRIAKLKQQLAGQPKHNIDAPIPARTIPNSPTAPLRTMMGNFSVLCPPNIGPPSQWMVPQSTNPFLQKGPMAPTNLFADHSTRQHLPAD